MYIFILAIGLTSSKVTIIYKGLLGDCFKILVILVFYNSLPIVIFIFLNPSLRKEIKKNFCCRNK